MKTNIKRKHKGPRHLRGVLKQGSSSSVKITSRKQKELKAKAFKANCLKQIMETFMNLTAPEKEKLQLAKAIELFQILKVIKFLKRFKTFSLLLDPGRDYTKYYTLTMKQLRHLYFTTNTIKELCNNSKAEYNSLVRHAMGKLFRPNTPKSFKRFKGGPISVSESFDILAELRSKDLLKVRIILSFYRYFELFEATPLYDISTIVDDVQDPATLNLGIDQFKSWLNSSTNGFTAFIKGRMLKLNTNKKLENKSSIPFHVNTKKGPGGPVCGTFYSQLLSLDNSIISNMNTITRVISGEEISKYIEHNKVTKKFLNTFELFENMTPKQQSQNENFVGKVSFLSDRACKTRVVASSNYWLQLTLKPLHDLGFDILKRLYTDSTKDQQKGAERVKRASAKGKVWSFDLTAATDRLPALLPKYILEVIFGASFAKSWYELLTSNLFLNLNGTNIKRDSAEGNKAPRTVKYKIGQPMGFYSSWTIGLALTHHFIVHYCYFLAYGKTNVRFNKYQILGDDIAIWDHLVATKYKDYMSSTLQVKINEGKSFVPDVDNDTAIGGRYNVAEFAKRQFINGTEITPITPKLINILYEDPATNIGETLAWLDNHGIDTEVFKVNNILNALNLNDPKQNRMSLKGSTRSNVLHVLYCWSLLNQHKLLNLRVMNELAKLYTLLGIKTKPLPVPKIYDLLAIRLRYAIQRQSPTEYFIHKSNKELCRVLEAYNDEKMPALDILDNSLDVINQILDYARSAKRAMLFKFRNILEKPLFESIKGNKPLLNKRKGFQFNWDSITSAQEKSFLNIMTRELVAGLEKDHALIRRFEELEFTGGLQLSDITKGITDVRKKPKAISDYTQQLSNKILKYPLGLQGVKTSMKELNAYLKEELVLARKKRGSCFDCTTLTSNTYKGTTKVLPKSELIEISRKIKPTLMKIITRNRGIVVKIIKTQES